jgi:hypothetical protein
MRNKMVTPFFPKNNFSFSGKRGLSHRAISHGEQLLWREGNWVASRITSWIFVKKIQEITLVHIKCFLYHWKAYANIKDNLTFFIWGYEIKVMTKKKSKVKFSNSFLPPRSKELSCRKVGATRQGKFDSNSSFCHNL